MVFGRKALGGGDSGVEAQRQHLARTEAALVNVEQGIARRLLGDGLGLDAEDECAHEGPFDGCRPYDGGVSLPQFGESSPRARSSTGSCILTMPR